ncbi:unnamed protein product, partial [Mesorhabditis spiculigera]
MNSASQDQKAHAQARMKLLICLTLLVAAVLAAEDSLFDKSDPNDPCEGTNMERRDGGAACADEACVDVVGKENGNYRPRACIKIFVTNGCHCKAGFVRRIIAGKECIKPEQCKRG